MRTTVTLLLVMIGSSFATAADPVVGDRVLVKDDVVKKHVKWGGKAEDLLVPATIEEVFHDQLRLKQGWFLKDEVMFVVEALKFYNQQIQREPKNAAAWRRRALIWEDSSEYSNAVEDDSEAIRLDPNNAAAYMHRGNMWSKEGNQDNAIDDYTEVLRIDSKCVEAYIHRGLAWRIRNEQEKAIDDFTNAVKLEPWKAPAYTGRGFSWLAIGEFGNAIDDFTDAIRIDRESAESYVGRAYAWYRLRCDKEAIADYEDAIQLEPNSSDACSGLAWMLATCPDGKYRNGERAIKLATKACKLTDWNDADKIETLAAAYAEARDWDRAVKRQRQYIEMVEAENDKQNGQKHLELYQQKQPYRELPAEAPPNPPELGQFIRQNPGSILLGALLVVMAYVVMFLVFPLLRERRIARQNEALRAPDGAVQASPFLEIVTIATFPSLPKAEACKLHLESEGVTVFLSDAETVRMDWLLSNAIGSVKIQVPGSQARNATALLEEMGIQQDRQSKHTDDTRCLACGAQMPGDASQCQACGWSYSKNGMDDDEDDSHA